METAISLPFTIDSFGNVGVTSSQSKIWEDRVRATIGTNLRERVMSPEFGTLVPTAFMETSDNATSLIQTEVARAFNIQLRPLKLQDVSITFDEYAGSLNISIVYDLPNNETVSTTVALISVDGTTPATQENL